MCLKNTKGSTLVENIVSVLLLSIFSLLVFSSLVAATNALKNAWTLDNTITEGYNSLEETYTSSGDGIQVESATITFKIEGDNTTYTIDGSIIYDEEEMVGEFVKDED